MANRRLGGMGGPQRGNRPFSQHQPFQGGVSPWQGNVPSNNSMNQGGLLGQLASNPQQLALALTSLLQPQQQQMNNPPSLLSLNTSPAFSQDRDSFNRFGGNRGRSDFRRNEPYNKNRNGPGGGSGGWRQLDSNNSRNGPGGGNMQNRNRNFGNFGGNQNNRRRNSPQRQRKDGDGKQQQQQRKSTQSDANKSKDEKSTKDSTKESTKEGVTETLDLTVDEANRDEEADGETKRGWKEEKKSGDAEEGGDGDGEDGEKKEGAKDLDGKYYGVPAKLLHCFVCNKDMWDGESFQKHIRGRAHKQMLQSVEESFHITVNILRENMRLSEEKKVIELNRMQRLNKNKYGRKYNEPESHCNMCDLKFLGKIIAHRKTEGHQRLKRFLHPNCRICNKEFPSRMEWVDHRLTPEHLRQLAEVLEKKAGDEHGDVIVEEEEGVEAELEPMLEESMVMEDDNPILELTDDLNNLQNRLPAFRKSRAVGTQNVKPFTGFMCDICHRSFESEDLAKTHLKTEGHYYIFIEAAKLKYKKQMEEEAKEKEREAEQKKRKRQEEEAEKGDASKEENADESQNGTEDAEMYDPEEACNEEEEEEGNAVKDEEAEEAKDVEAEVKPEVKEEPSPQATTPGRVTRRAVGAVGGAVKNGAGPKSKKLALLEEKTGDPASQKLSAFRIPKLKAPAKEVL